MQSPKIYVDVIAKFSMEDGVPPKPLSITWEDGREYEIDRIDNIRQAASQKACGIGIR